MMQSQPSCSYFEGLLLHAEWYPAAAGISCCHIAGGLALRVQLLLVACRPYQALPTRPGSEGAAG
jgi:hypothetical protein